ncbi:hypothetical protein LshimejAT787_1005550 [Lyophyllum shimeji]|uniref:Uncharacterized protein n=1 Tax=Lyophyllum shimeji TaxID=47721 RepID=A0A9P3PSH6_LYOSH|nr:hypothetical protein LshimejAT787_1005550 [Lyophyllum shimeji]
MSRTFKPHPPGPPYHRASYDLRADKCHPSKGPTLCSACDLHAMRTFAGLDAAKFMTIAAQLNPEEPEETSTDGDPKG